MSLNNSQVLNSEDNSEQSNSAAALIVHWRVVKALMLRDIRTRFFGNGFGYIVAIAWPLTHIIVLVALYSLAGRATPLGDSVFLFFSVGLIPTICFQYLSRFIMISSLVNKPLLNFPAVTFYDVIAARSLLETACSVLVAVLLSFILICNDVNVLPWNTVEAAKAFGAAIFLGLSTGYLNAVIVLKYPGWSLLFILVSITMWVTSGVLFLPNSMATEVVDVFAWNPLLHTVEWMREAFYSEYQSPVLSKRYVLVLSMSFLFSGLFLTRFFKKFLLQ